MAQKANQTEQSNRIKFTNVRVNNLKNVSGNLPTNCLISVTGVSGSGKSSFIFDTIYRESQRRQFRLMFSNQSVVSDKFSKPDCDEIKGLSPAIAVGQQASTYGNRSTVGTLSSIYDLIRLLYSRFAKSNDRIDKTSLCSIFSFNSPHGMCPDCKGIGVDDIIAEDLLIADENRTLREGAMIPTNPNGYIIYSQVTIDVLNRVCNEHGFNVDIPWKDLTREQKDVVLYGSEKIKIPFGKHPLENRLKWKGITAKPREEGYYRGMIPIMNEILKRDRNDNILRFAKTIPCPTCNGSRLLKTSLEYRYQNLNIAELSNFSLSRLFDFFAKIKTDNPAETELIKLIMQKLKPLINLGVGYLTLNRLSDTLSRGEIGRIKLTNLASSGLQGVLFILDEPSTGLHPEENRELLKIIREIVSHGNTVLLVEHDPYFIFNSDWVLEFGPFGGSNGGNIIFNGSINEFKEIQENDAGALLNLSTNYQLINNQPKDNLTDLKILGISSNNLKNIDLTIKYRAINAITGVSGSGKKTLVKSVIEAINNYVNHNKLNGNTYNSLSLIDKVKGIVIVDRKPVGKNSRSNPATYTKLFDLIRKLFSSLEDAKNAGLDKTHFSFNLDGGRCEHCQGAGYTKLGLMFLGEVRINCPECDGKRFKDNVLQIKYNNLNISEVLDLTVSNALKIFKDNSKISSYLAALNDIGLGYLKLGQPSSTLSGGESQRLKLATILAKKTTTSNLFVFEEPTTGLHIHDIKPILLAFKKLVKSGNTIICIEHNEYFLENSDWIIELGSNSQNSGSKLIYEGAPQNISIATPTGKAIKTWRNTNYSLHQNSTKSCDSLSLISVRTNNLKNIDVHIPHNKITTISGISGSGKSSLAFDTLVAEGQRLFNYHLSSHARRYIRQLPKPALERVVGMKSTVAFRGQSSSFNPRSTVATSSGLYDLLRILFSRCGISPDNKSYPASAFSFNNSNGACECCHGNGFILQSQPENIITNQNVSIYDGAISGTKEGKFYSKIDGQFIAILKEVEKVKNLNFNIPVKSLDKTSADIMFFGTGDELYNVKWEFKRKNRTGEHNWQTKWAGFCNLITEEYDRKHHDNRGVNMLHLLSEVPCKNCMGSRLKANILSVKFLGKNISEFCNQSINEVYSLIKNLHNNEKLLPGQKSVVQRMQSELETGLSAIVNTGLGYLELNRRSDTLSNGEQQRLKLASQFIAEMQNIIYVFDEPSSGLHPKDNQLLFNMLKSLKTIGNTIVIVEHDNYYIENSDYLIELGPGAGTSGGNVVNSGEVSKIKTESSYNKLSLEHTSSNQNNSYMYLTGASARNLKHIDVKLLLNCINCISGVSGSGKSTLVNEVILPSIKNNRPVNCSGLDIDASFSNIFIADQTPVHTSKRSSVATFTGAFEHIRSKFASIPECVAKKIKKSWFSYNTKGGRCEKCKGMGEVTIKMDLIADMTIPCDECGQTGFSQQTNQFKYNNFSISDVLGKTVDDCVNIFSDDKKLIKIFSNLKKCGLGYLSIGQRTSTLSAGELQRLKIAKNIDDIKNSVFIFDEPSKGLHFKDIVNIAKLLNELKAKKNTIIIVDHNPQIQANADHIIDLGPVGGKEGGYLVIQGTPSDIINCNSSDTGKYLKYFYRKKYKNM